MPAHNNLNKLLLHNVRVASDVCDAATLQERTERSLSLAESFCHSKGSHSNNVSWTFVEFVLGGESARKHSLALPAEFSSVVGAVVNNRKQLRKHIGEIVSKVELRVPLHHTYPVPRAIWAGTLGRPAPTYELRRRGTDQFAVSVRATVDDPYTGTGSIEHRYFGDSNHAVPLDMENRVHPITVNGFVLSASGVERGDEQFPSIIYGRDTLLSVVGHEGLESKAGIHLLACLNQIDPHKER